MVGLDGDDEKSDRDKDIDVFQAEKEPAARL